MVRKARLRPSPCPSVIQELSGYQQTQQTDPVVSRSRQTASVGRRNSHQDRLSPWPIGGFFPDPLAIYPELYHCINGGKEKNPTLITQMFELL